MYSTKDVATYYHITEQTIRAWAKEFAEYLSPLANPAKGKSRTYSLDDFGVFSLVSELKNQNMTFEDIHIQLQAGQRGEIPSLDEKTLKVLSATEGEKRASLEIQALQRHVIDLQERLKKTEEIASRVGAVEQENTGLKSEIRLLREQQEQTHRLLQEALERERNNAQELAERLGHEYARGLLDALQRTGKLPGGEGDEK